MNEVSIEFWGVVIVALSSIFTNILTWFLNYRSARIKFETETRAGYVQEVLRDHYKLYNFLRQLMRTPVKEVAQKATEEINNIVNERPYNFKATIIEKWIGLYETITLYDEQPSDEEMKDFQKDLWERIDYFEKQYERMLGIERR